MREGRVGELPAMQRLNPTLLLPLWAHTSHQRIWKFHLFIDEKVYHGRAQVSRQQSRIYIQADCKSDIF